MTQVIADISISLDGFVTGPDPGPEQGLGVGGEPIHRWVSEADETDADVLQQAFDRTGAVVMGRRLFDVIDSPQGWNEEMGYGAGHAGQPPFVVLTSVPPAKHRLTGLDFSFVTDGPAAAVELARRRAAAKDVVIMGGGRVVESCLRAGLVDELSLHISGVLMGSGTPLFGVGAPARSLRTLEVRPSSHAIHVRYAVGS